VPVSLKHVSSYNLSVQKLILTLNDSVQIYDKAVLELLFKNN